MEPQLKDTHNITDNSESPDDGEQTLIDITEHCFVSLHPLSLLVHSAKIPFQKMVSIIPWHVLLHMAITIQPL